MTWSFRNLRPHLKLLIASGLGVLVLLSPGKRAHLANQALAQSAGQSNRRPLDKPNAGAVSHSAGAASLPAPRSGWIYPQRQTLTYEVDWRVFPAGTATLHMESNGDSQRLTVSGDSTGAINLLFRVTDHFQATFNRQTGCSSGFAKQLVEGSRQVNSDQQFSGGQSRATVDEKNLINHSHHAEQTAIPGCVSDALSAIFYAASQSLQVGQTLHVPVMYGPNVLDVTARVEGHEAVRTPATTYQTVRVQPTWANTAVRNSGNIWVWYSDDDRHLPVQVRARLFWGTITFRLTGVEQK